MDDFEREVFQMGQRASALTDATQDERVKRLLLEASETLLAAAKRVRTGPP
jgi:hypothetical protein